MFDACHPRWSWIDDEESRKAFNLEKGKIVYIDLKWIAQGKGIILIGFPFCRSHVCWETGFRIDNRTIKRGSRMSNSVTLFGERSNLCILSIILSWLLFGSYPCKVLELVVIFITSPSSSKTDFPFISYCVFDLAGFTGLSFRDR